MSQACTITGLHPEDTDIPWGGRDPNNVSDYVSFDGHPGWVEVGRLNSTPQPQVGNTRNGDIVQDSRAKYGWKFKREQNPAYQQASPPQQPLTGTPSQPQPSTAVRTAPDASQQGSKSDSIERRSALYLALEWEKLKVTLAESGAIPVDQANYTPPSIQDLKLTANYFLNYYRATPEAEAPATVTETNPALQQLLTDKGISEQIRDMALNLVGAQSIGEISPGSPAEDQFKQALSL